MTQTTKKLRLNMTSFNLAKGFAMIIIVFGHMHSSVNYESEPLLYGLFAITYILRSGLIPMFMLITGYGFKEKPVFEFVKKSISELLVPYVLILAAHIVVYPVVAYLQFGDWGEVIYRLKGILLAFVFGIPKLGRVLLGIEVRWCAAAWFLLALFVSMNGLNVILKVKNRWVQILLAAACIAVGYQMIIRDWNFWCIPQGLLCTGYCYVGYLMKKEKLLEKIYDKVWVYAVLVAISAAQTVWGYCDLAFGTFNNITLDYIGSGCFGVLLMLTGVVLGRKEWKALDGIKEVGVYTYWILCVHAFEMLCFPWDNLKIWFPTHHILVLACEAVVRVMIIACGCLVLKRIMKYYYKRSMKKANEKRLLQKSGT